jgi:hypothetical protein
MWESECSHILERPKFDAAWQSGIIVRISHAYQSLKIG